MIDALENISSIFKVTWSNHKSRIIYRRFEEPAHCLAIKKRKYNKPWFHDIRKMPLALASKPYENYPRDSFKVTVNGHPITKVHT